ncbi:Aminopeptidase 2 mitochondrial, partial [Tulasnella sp. 408]
YYALTQFEATNARRAFPSWDEPLLKATYDVTMISRADTVNLSNMPVTSEKPFLDAASSSESDKGPQNLDKLAKMFSLKSEDTTGDTVGRGWKVTKFERTPLMSTYLLGFANGHFEYLESSYTSPLSGRKIPLRIYTTPDIVHQGQFSLDVTAKVMPIYEQVFQIEYPLPKLDLLAAHDFDGFAMENWGLITGRTLAFLLDPKKSSLAAKKDVATVTSHEVWWDNLWLKEGFATLIMGEVIAIEKYVLLAPPPLLKCDVHYCPDPDVKRIFPEWKVDSEFINGELARALGLDAVRSSHPIEVPVPEAKQISLLRMLSNYVGEETFLRGVSIYLSKHLYGNSVTRDLWKGIGEASGLDIPKMMDNWILKIGYPVVTVEESSDSITVRQDRFLSTGDPSEKENETLWQIPLNVKTADASGKVSTDHSVVLSEREARIPLDTSKPFKLNAQTTGVYRVSYTPGRLTKIGEEAAKENSVFSLEDRMGLVSDALILAKAGISQTSAALDLIKSLKNEKEYLVWAVVDSQLAELGAILWEQPEESLVKPLIDRLGYEYSSDDSADTIQLRTLAIAAAADAKDTDVVAELTARFKHFQETRDDSRIPADLLHTTFITAVRNGGRAEYETVKKVYKNPPTPSAKASAIHAMTASKDTEIIEETLKFVLTDAQIQDAMDFFSGAASNRDSRRRIGEFFKENCDTITKMYGGVYSLSSLVKSSFQGLTTEKDADAIEAWFKDKDVSKYNLALAQSLDRIRANAKWLERCKGEVTDWLKTSKL